MLPVGPIGRGDSPYASTSSFAGEPLLVALEGLRDAGLLSKTEMTAARRAVPRRLVATDFVRARAAKEPALLAAFESFRLGRGFESASYRAFVHRASPWLPGWQAFMNDTHGYHAFLQFQFDEQWRALRVTCRQVGVRLMGDLPIFVALDSADVQEQPRRFRLDRRGRPTVVTGVPPDCFSVDGQRWGHPHYRWSVHRREGFAWWVLRIAVSLERFDALRVDHFVGFHHAYEIAASSRTARRGTWRRQPGMELLRAARKAVGQLPLVAEDLGAVTAEVVALRRAFGLPGMQVLQHAFGEDDSPTLPHRHDRSTVVYTGTHDNDTTVGWARSLDAPSMRRFVASAGKGTRTDPAGALTRLAYGSAATLAIIPMQDCLRLGRTGRMNTPGTATGNWRWRLDDRWQGHGRRVARELRQLAVRADRLSLAR